MSAVSAMGGERREVNRRVEHGRAVALSKAGDDLEPMATPQPYLFPITKAEARASASSKFGGG